VVVALAIERRVHPLHSTLLVIAVDTNVVLAVENAIDVLIASTRIRICSIGRVFVLGLITVVVPTPRTAYASATACRYIVVVSPSGGGEGMTMMGK
jgi:hypothetical protein